VVGVDGVRAAGTARSVVPDQTSGREITRYDVTADVAADGTVQVALDFDFDFGDDPGHGPYLSLPTRVRYDDEWDRRFRYRDVSVTSPTGAPAALDVEDDGSAVVWRIGDPDVDDVSGVQTYHVEYTADGLLNPANAQHSGDELYWNVIGPGWEIPLGDLSVRVTGPAPVEGAVCFSGPYGSDEPCSSATADGDTATYAQDLLPVGALLTVTTGWPAGTFPGVEPILVPPLDPVAGLRPLTAGGAVALLVVVGGIGLAAARVRRVGRDRAYLGLTPGLRPGDGAGDGQAAGFRDRRSPVAVQFVPPPGVRPGEVGTLVDEKADPTDVTATLVDLAVRGYLRIDEVPRSDPRKKPKDWTLVRLRPVDDTLLAFERTLLDRIFAGREEVRLSDLRTTFASSMAEVQKGMYAHVTTTGWFRANPQRVRTSWVALGIVLLVLGFAGAVVVLATGMQVAGLALVPAAVALVGLVVTVLSHWAPARTADGTAVLAQALGFRRYLATAEADQLRFEEGEDIFSRYLPYAIVFGLTERWARVFADLAAQGRTTAQPGWYTGRSDALVAGYWATHLAGAVGSFSAVATSALSAPTPGSSGGSGSSGGFSGGGVGGGGGGGW